MTRTVSAKRCDTVCVIAYWLVTCDQALFSLFFSLGGRGRGAWSQVNWLAPVCSTCILDQPSVCLLWFRLYNIPACYLGSAQTNNAEKKDGILRWVTLNFRFHIKTKRCDITEKFIQWCFNPRIMHFFSAKRILLVISLSQRRMFFTWVSHGLIPLQWKTIFAVRENISLAWAATEQIRKSMREDCCKFRGF